MKVLLLANVNSSHTRKWCEGLAREGLEIGLFSINKPQGNVEWTGELAYCYLSPFSRSNILRYLPIMKMLKNALQEFKPDAVHSHYITNYTLLGALSGSHPHLATAWGSDVYQYPKLGLLQRSLIRFNLRKADVLISTSHCMKREMQKYTSRKVEVIPFGVDFKKFNLPHRRNTSPIIACFKHLESTYGHDTLLTAFSILIRKMKDTRLSLLLVGDGSQRLFLENLAARLGIREYVEFKGSVPAHRIPDMLAEVDLCVYLSRRESFGVSVVESMAARVPLVLTPAEGFREVAEGCASFVPFDDAESAAQKMFILLNDGKLRMELTERAYERAHQLYELGGNIRQQVLLYKEAVGR